MPDTGAPWYIPYVSGTDLVSDWPTDSQDLATAIADGLDAAGNAGIGTNVVQAFKTDIFSTTSATFTDITGLTATITPSSNTSKILVISHIQFGGPSTQTYRAELRRGSTSVGIATTGTNPNSFVLSSNVAVLASMGFHVFLDSPATTSATTYSWRVATNAGTLYVNRWTNDANTTGTSSITLIEVAA